MATTIRLPDELLAAIDRRAAELGMSRSQYLRQTLERAIDEETRWSPAFLDTLAAGADDPDLQHALDEMRDAMAANRTTKGPPDL
jgi:Arc/MetJ-type ribon-helix-helix transcriptional regulator